MLNGTLRYVIDGHTADLLIIAARAEKLAGRKTVFPVSSQLALLLAFRDAGRRPWIKPPSNGCRFESCQRAKVCLDEQRRCGVVVAAQNHQLAKLLSRRNKWVVQEILDRTVAFLQNACNLGAALPASSHQTQSGGHDAEVRKSRAPRCITPPACNKKLCK